MTVFLGLCGVWIIALALFLCLLNNPDDSGECVR